MQLPNELKQAIDNNAFCALSTKINEKEMQNHLMWVDYKDNKILINTEQGRNPSDMYTCWEIRGVVKNIVQDSTANDHIDYLSNRYSGKPYGRTENVTWEQAGFKSREIEISKKDFLQIILPECR